MIQIYKITTQPNTIEIMKLLSEKELTELDIGTLIYFEEFYDKFSEVKYRKWGKIFEVEKNTQGVGYWIKLSIMGDFKGNTFYNDNITGKFIHNRFSKWNKFYLPEKEIITNKCLQRSLEEVIDKYTNNDMSNYTLGLIR